MLSAPFGSIKLLCLKAIELPRERRFGIIASLTQLAVLGSISESVFENDCGSNR